MHCYGRLRRINYGVQGSGASSKSLLHCLPVRSNRTVKCITKLPDAPHAGFHPEGMLLSRTISMLRLLVLLLRFLIEHCDYF